MRSDSTIMELSTTSQYYNEMTILSNLPVTIMKISEKLIKFLRGTEQRDAGQFKLTVV